MDWKDKARWEVLRAAHSSDAHAAPVYRVPKHRPWWLFWKPVEWEEVRGVSRAQMERFADAVRADQRARLEVMGNADPMANIYAPWVDAALAARRDSDTHRDGQDGVARLGS